MKRFTFRGGAHPNDQKDASRYYKIEKMPAPKMLILPLSQHIGARARAIVEEGSAVAIGQKIAEADGVVSANIHSPVSGVVKEIAPHMHPGGMMVDSIVIENNGENTLVAGMYGFGDLESLSPQVLRDAIREAGIVGMGGAAFPTHVKLSPPAGASLSHCIINGAECEPYLTSDHRVMLEQPEKVLFSCRVIMRATGAERGYIAIERNKTDAIEMLKRYARPFANIEVVALETKYPQGSEKQLISTVLKREVPPGKLPLDLGVVVNNIDTCAAISDCINLGLPLISRVVTVCGGAFGRTQNFEVLLGTPISHIIDYVGGFVKPPDRVLTGGPMMGLPQCTFDVPIIKGTGALLALTKQETEMAKPTACLRCGRCVSGCPMRLQPVNLYKAAERRDTHELRQLNLTDCMECGVCTYLCPAKIHLLQHIKVGKTLLAEKAVQ
ncbi:MAG: electron transport complex subunit RsxC [Clostridiales bacterium]|nr:electron transport complex subunit RsxC [Clostridiales bacterium]